jgi:hypothetical protein
MIERTDKWPDLVYDEYKPTRDSLHMVTQMVGKIRLGLTPPQAQWARAPVRLSRDGLTTTPLWVGDGLLEVDIDLVRHELRFDRSDGRQVTIALRPRPISEVYADVLGALDRLGVDITLNPRPQEIPDPIPFNEDTVHSAYDPQQANRIWQALIRAGAVFEQFQSGYWGKHSQVNFNWGGFDLSVTRYSGRPAQRPQGLPPIMTGSLDAEMINVLFSPGRVDSPQPGFVAMAFPTQPGIETASIRPDAARWIEMPGMGGMFVVSYEDVRSSRDPRRALLEFALSAYEAFAEIGGWDRGLLEQRPPEVVR